MNETQAYIERIMRVNRSYQRIELAVDSSLTQLRSGQAVLARRIEKDYEIELWNPYLRDLWFPVEVPSSNHLVIERPSNYQYIPGQLFNLLGPVGQPFRFRRSVRNILFMIYDTTPTAILMAIKPLLANDVSVTMVLMGTAKAYDTQHLPPEVEIIRAEDDLTWDDMVMTLGWADQVFAVVGQGDELAYFSKIMTLLRERRTDVPEKYVFGVFQNILPCGIGACYACVLKTKQGTKLQCVDGPAFDLTTLRLD
jgi:hypothetical protein